MHEGASKLVRVTPGCLMFNVSRSASFCIFISPKGSEAAYFDCRWADGCIPQIPSFKAAWFSGYGFSNSTNHSYTCNENPAQ